MRPLERMGATARTIAASGLGSRVAPSNERTEVGQLGLALNGMLSQIERAFAQRDVTEQKLRHFVSDASHELRTPLTSMRGYAELLQRNPDMSRDDVLLAVRRIEDETRRNMRRRSQASPEFCFPGVTRAKTFLNAAIAYEHAHRAVGGLKALLHMKRNPWAALFVLRKAQRVGERVAVRSHIGLAGNGSALAVLR